MRYLVLIPLIFINLLTNPCQALLSKDLKSFDKTLMKSPESYNQNLNKKVDFSFKDIKLSEVLVLLSKVGDFNVILPEEFDREISVKITDQKVIDAIDDIADLTRLNYEFKSNSLIFSNSDIKGMKFVSVPVVYYSADKIVKALNEELFRQFAISQNRKSISAHAAKDPAKNSIILFGNEEQIKAAKDFIDELDTNPKLSLYSPVYLNIKDIKKLAHSYFNADYALSIKRFDDQSILIKGLDKEVDEMVTVLKKHDKKPKELNLVASFYTYKFDRYLEIRDVLDSPYLTLIKYDKDSKDEIFNHLELVEETEFVIRASETMPVKELQIQANRNILDPNKYDLKIFDTKKIDQSIFLDVNFDKAMLVLDESYLRKNKNLEKLSNKQDAKLVVLIIQAK